MNIIYDGEDRWFNDVLVRSGQNWIEGDRLSRLLAHPEWVELHQTSENTESAAVWIGESSITSQEVEFINQNLVSPPAIPVVEIVGQSSVTEVDPPPKPTRLKK